MKVEDIESSGLEFSVQEYQPPYYTQLVEPQMPYLSALDAVFMLGPDANSIFKDV